MLFFIGLLLLGGAVDSAQKPLIHCDASWWQYNGHCYSFSSLIYNRTDAASFCKQNKATLTTIENEEFNKWYTLATPGATPWFGLKCSGSEKSSCTWENGQPLGEYSNFRQGHPNLALGDCIAFDNKQWDTGVWVSSPCKTEQYFTCKKGPMIIKG